MHHRPQSHAARSRPTARPSVRPFLRGLLALVLLWAGPARAQGEPATPPRVVLPVSSEAQGRLEAAGRLLDKRQWEAAFPLLQRIIKDGSLLVSLDGPLVPARAAATRMIAAAPEEGRELYAILHEAEARDLLARAVRDRSYAGLRDVADLYLNTHSGVRACSAMAALLMDEGRYAPALQALQRTDMLPLTPRQAGPIMARKMVCLARLGDEQRAAEVLAEAQAAGIDAIDLGGRTWTPERLMHEAFASRAPATPERVTALPRAESFDCSFRLALPAEGPRTRRTLCPPPSPAVQGNGLAFVNRGGAVLAVDTSAPRIRWVAHEPGWLRRAAYALASPGSPTEPAALHLPLESTSDWRDVTNRGLSTLSTADGRVYAVQADLDAVSVPGRTWEARPSELEFPNRLRCYDAANGRLLWSQGAAGSALAGFWFFSAPGLKNGRAYVLGTRHGVLWAVCLDSRTGEPVWRSRIGPLESRQEVRRLLMELYVSDANPPVARRGVALYPTGQGMLCGFNAYDGTLLWVTRYERAQVRTSRLGQALTVPRGSWGARAPLTRGDLCVLAPLDSRSVVAVSMGTGRLLWQRRFEHGRAVLGQTDGLIYVQDSGLTCLQAASGKAVWQVRTRESSTGIGTVTTDTVYLPTADGIAARDARTGEPLGILRCPVRTPVGGVLLPLDNGFLAADREMLTFALLAGDRARPPSPAGGGYGDDVTPAIVRACGAPPRQAERYLRSALEAAGQSGDRRHAAQARNCIAPHLARVAVQLGDPELLRALGPADELGPEARTVVARARLRIALDSPAGGNAAGTYVQLIRKVGMLEEAGPFSERSLWTELARMVRETTEGDAGAARELHGHFADLVERAARDGHPEELALLARMGPFPGTRAAALEALAWVCSESEPLRARRALLASAFADGRGREPEPVAGQATAPGSPRLWSRRGYPVPPADLSEALPGDRLLIADGDYLHCVSGDDGNTLWSAELPPAPSTGASGRGSLAPRKHVGAGYPVYQVNDDVLMVALPSVVLVVDPADGAIRHRLPAGRPWARYGTSVPMSRARWIRRAVCGLSLPPRDARPFRRLDDFLVSRIAACRIEAGLALSLLDPRTGEELFRKRGSREQPFIGLQAAFVGNWLCALVPEPDRLLLVDPVDGQPVARWVLRESSGLHAMVSTSGHTVYLADRDAIWRFDVRAPELTARWNMPGGVERLIYADEDVLLIESVTGRTQLLSAETGCEMLALDAEGAAVWAGRRGGVLYLLQAGDYRAPVPYGQEVHAMGSGFALHALRLSDGEALWEYAMPAEQLRVVGPPLPEGDVWLLRWSSGDAAGVVGLRASDGAEIFRAEVPVTGNPAPVSLLPVEKAVILGAGGTTFAFTPREGATR